MGKFFFVICFTLAVSGRVFAAAESGIAASNVVSAARKNWEFDFETGILWRAGHNGTYLNYTIMPQILTLKTAPVARRTVAGGGLTLRSRFSLLLEPIIKGPENHFFGVTASGFLEWWNAPRTFSLFFSSGGGLG